MLTRGREVELGLGVQTNRNADEYVHVARLAEASGFDVISVFHDLGFQPAIVPLTLIARATTRVRLGPAALNPWTLHPFEIAAQVAALDAVSGGRAYLGLAQGAWLDELGIDEERPLAGMREAVEVVRRVLAGDTSGFEGERFRLAAGRGLHFDHPRDAIPLMLGTWRPRMAALAGEVASELKIGGCANPEMARLVRAWIGNDDVRLVVGAVTVIDEDGDAARALARRTVELYLPIVGELDVTLERGPEEPPPLEPFVLAGTPAEVVQRVEALVDAGVGRVEFGPPWGTTAESGLRLLADDVLSRFHDRA
ncbi:MAG TPA: LLM class flavin-dependent oxidoreductase [Gaiellaceae bacterium]|nr:LLM class flavin-dependent oxidoreductase [Gaiellaceae bacterium]